MRPGQDLDTLPDINSGIAYPISTEEHILPCRQHTVLEVYNQQVFWDFRMKDLGWEYLRR